LPAAANGQAKTEKAKPANKEAERNKNLDDLKKATKRVEDAVKGVEEDDEDA
jgi:hypothetical protein